MIGPEIRALYLNDTTFVDGGQVNTTPYFVAELWDKSGVNITGSSVGPVSYTHLDVYKRQIYGWTVVQG